MNDTLRLEIIRIVANNESGNIGNLRLLGRFDYEFAGKDLLSDVMQGASEAAKEAGDWTTMEEIEGYFAAIKNPCKNEFHNEYCPVRCTGK